MGKKPKSRGMEEYALRQYILDLINRDPEIYGGVNNTDQRDRVKAAGIDTDNLIKKGEFIDKIITLLESKTGKESPMKDMLQTMIEQCENAPNAEAKKNSILGLNAMLTKASEMIDKANRPTPAVSPIKAVTPPSHSDRHAASAAGTNKKGLFSLFKDKVRTIKDLKDMRSANKTAKELYKEETHQPKKPGR